MQVYMKRLVEVESSLVINRMIPYLVSFGFRYPWLGHCEKYKARRFKRQYWHLNECICEKFYG